MIRLPQRSSRLLRSGILVFVALAPTALVQIAAVPRENLRETVEWLADPAREGRESRSAGAAATAAYLMERFSLLGFEPELQPIGPGRQNVVARWGTASRHVIIGAHYDGQGRGHPSASDNAAGVAVLLELARELRESDLPVSFVFIAFDDEERGLFGSRHYAENPLYPLDAAAAVVILDTMGRSFVDLDRWSLFVFGAEFSPELDAVVSGRDGTAMVRLGTDLLGARSDYAPFAARQVPYLFFTNATHEDYHGPNDVAGRLRYDRLAGDAAIVRDVIIDIAGLETGPRFRNAAVYPETEGRELIAYLEAVERERPDLGTAYAPVFDDLRARLGRGVSRADLRLAAAVMLSAATPRLSFFPLMYLIGPFYETEGRTAAAQAVYREARRWAPDDDARAAAERKIASLEP